MPKKIYNTVTTHDIIELERTMNALAGAGWKCVGFAIVPGESLVGHEYVAIMENEVHDGG